MELNDEQQKAVEYVLTGENVFLTGCAGTGKSYTIDVIVQKMRDRNKKVDITASTGLAATNIKGRTLHSWAGIGIDMNENRTKLVGRIMKDKAKYDRWMKVDLLIIDEVSMIDYKFIEVLDDIAKYLRSSSEPFGGIQILLAGDFFQLPPVQKERKEPIYLFEHSIWNTIISKNVMLTKIYRQENKEFIEILDRIRHNKITEEDEKTIMKTCKNKLDNEWGVKPTQLLCTRRDVNKMNDNELRKIKADNFHNKAFEYYRDDEVEKMYKNNWKFQTDLNLKVGAQVMLLTNTYPGYCNGSRGVVEKIENGEIIVRFLDGGIQNIGKELFEIKDNVGKVIASIEQYPLMLAWCLTVHKSQGQTIELVDIDLQKVFTYAQAYVAISRGVGLGKMRILNFSKKSVRTNQKVIRFYEKIKESEENDLQNRFRKKQRLN